MYRRILHWILKKNIQKGVITISYQGKQNRYGNPQDLVQGFIEVKHPNFFERVIKYGEIGLGESYIAGEWTSSTMLDTMLVFSLNFAQLSPAKIRQFSFASLRALLEKYLFAKKPMSTSELDSKKGMSITYDVGNDFFEKMLGESRLYTCAFFRNKKNTLEEAQNHKLNVILQKLALKREQQVIDIGCGWGTLLNKIHKEWGCAIRGISLSKEQIRFCQDHYAKGQFDYLDYRQLSEENHYDRVVSVGMLEHVGYENLPIFFKKVAEILKPNGRALIHTMIKGPIYPPYHRVSGHEGITFIGKHVMPVGYIPQCREVTNAIINTQQFRIIHQEKFGIHYGETVKRWRENVLKNADSISRSLSSDLVRVYDYMWAMVGSWFAVGCLDLLQIVIEKNPISVHGNIYDPRAN